MSTGAELVSFVSLRVHDASNAEITTANVLKMLNMALDDLIAANVVLPLAEDESITISSGTHSYSVPASFAYIRDLRLESAVGSGDYPNVISPTLYRVTVETGTTPIIFFDENEFDTAVEAGKKVKVTGQQRPAAIASDATVAPQGMAAFIRERAVAYTSGHLAPGVSELSQFRAQISQDSWEKSERLLSYLARTNRPLPDALMVPYR